MRNIIVFLLAAGMFIFSGCVIRSMPREVDRVDQEITGNRGFVRGTADEPVAGDRERTRTVYDIEIELPYKGKDRGEAREPETNYEPKRRTYEDKQKVTPRQKVMTSGPKAVNKEVPPVRKKYEKEKGSGVIIQEAPSVRRETPKPEPKKTQPKEYVIQKGDTLQKISKRFYGTTKKWSKIFEANKETLKNPDTIKPGQKIMIPPLD